MRLSTLFPGTPSVARADSSSLALVVSILFAMSASQTAKAESSSSSSSSLSSSSSSSSSKALPLIPYPSFEGDADVASLSFQDHRHQDHQDQYQDQDHRHLYQRTDNDSAQDALLRGDDDVDDDDDDVDDEVAFSVYEVDATFDDNGEEMEEMYYDGAEEEEEEEEEEEGDANTSKNDAGIANGANDDDDDDDDANYDDDANSIHKRNKRFVVRRGGSSRRRGSSRRKSSSTSTSSSSTSSRRRAVRRPEEKEESDGHGHAEGGGRRGGRGIKFTSGSRFSFRKGPSSSGKKKTTSTRKSSSTSTSSNRGSDSSLPEKPIWQIKWPKRGKTVRTAIQENELFKREVMKLKLKIGSLSEDQKKEILDQHNKYRGELPGVAGYPISEIPRAQDMQKMVWDKELEEKAKIHAEKCLFAHDTRKERHLDNLIVGQNIAVDTNSNFIESAVASWYGEIALCKWDLSGENAAKRQKKRCTEYSQMMWANTSRLGCASVWCPEVADWDHTGYNLVCNYGPEGNVVRTAPYTPASTDADICRKCPGKCQNNLCDCGGKVCYNGGTLDVGTCRCSCPSLWRGSTCKEKSCPPTDHSTCGLPYPKGYPKSYCDQYHDVPLKCPYMCGVCKGARCGGKKCINRGELDITTCECKCKKIFTGPTCKTLKCPEKDSWFCGTTWNKSYCRRIITAQFECPYMCNICKK